jgi:LuxR family maltose regulon positive regulatory protein
MPQSLLRTKLFVPPIRPNLVPRPQLIGRLNLGHQLDHKLTIISAPAGFGKTTLLSEWVSYYQAEGGNENHATTRIVWLSLDENDSDPMSFLSYLVAAFRQVDGSDAKVGKIALGMLQASQLPPIEPILTSLINDISTIPYRIILILDDYHLIDSPSVDDVLAFLIENLPLQIHLIVATRSDPDVPIARYRARGQLTELRGAELRFTLLESAEFLNRVMGLDLSVEEIAALEERTEGWIAGLQLAAISMRGNIDTASFIKSFTGSHRFVLDYLVEEVLDQQPENIQNFLLRTSILDRLTGSLCDTVCYEGTPFDQSTSQEILEVLDRANLFIIPLDDERQWYRYHHLFADLLRQRLYQHHDDLGSQLHLRASKWYEERDELPVAIHHALAAKDFEQVANLTELAWHPMNMSYRAVTWLGWVEALPDELVRSRPVLSTGCGWASLDAGDLNAADRHLRNAENWLEATVKAQDHLEAPNQQGIRSLAASVANARAYLAQALGDLPGTIKYARRATEFLRADDYFERGLAEILPGFAYWANGELEAAYEAVAKAIANMRMAGKLRFVISFTSYLCDIMVAQGRLLDAKNVYVQLLEIAARQDKPEIPETAVLHLGLSELLLEQGDVKAAEGHLQSSEALGEQHWFAPWYRHWIWAHALVLNAQKDFDRVIELLYKAETLYYRHPIPDIRPLKSMIARAWLSQSKLNEAWRYVGEQSPSIDDDLSYLHEFEHVTLVRVFIAQYTSTRVERFIDEALGLIERLMKAAEDGGRAGSLIEILVLQAVAYEAAGKMSPALASLERALTLAEPEGFVRIFVDEGPSMHRLLHAALIQAIAPDYVRRLMAAFSSDEAVHVDQSRLIEPLSERELELLQLIAEGLTNPEIATKLYLSLNTVKVHTRNIYGKLDVHSRTQAVARARELGILSSS